MTPPKLSRRGKSPDADTQSRPLHRCRFRPATLVSGNRQVDLRRPHQFLQRSQDRCCGAHSTHHRHASNRPPTDTVTEAAHHLTSRGSSITSTATSGGAFGFFFTKRKQGAGARLPPVEDSGACPSVSLPYPTTALPPLHLPAPPSCSRHPALTQHTHPATRQPGSGF